MGYGIILSFACVILAIRFACLGRASLHAKLIVGGIALASFVVPWHIAALLAQLADALFVLLYLKAYPSGPTRRPPSTYS